MTTGGNATQNGALREVQASVKRACEHLAETQDVDGAWRAQPEPRILENALLVLVSREIPELAGLSDNAKAFVERATPQTHHPIPKAVDAWLKAMVCGQPMTLDLSHRSFEEPTFRHRKVFFNAFAMYLGVPCYGGFAKQQLANTVREQIESRRVKQQKAWAAAELGALWLLLCSPDDVIDEGHVRESLAAIEEAQSLNGSMAENPLSTILAVAALNRWAPEGESTHRAIDYLKAAREADGTWRFGMTEVWDTALLLRTFARSGMLHTKVQQDAFSFLARAQNQDGGWPFRLGVQSDTDTTGMVLIAMKESDEKSTVNSGLDYLTEMQTESGLWRTWHQKNDEPAEDAIAHAVLAIDAYKSGSGLTERAKAWLGDQKSWQAHWYNSKPYAAFEIGSSVGIGHKATKEAASQLVGSQNEDGGWSPDDAEQSTPAATGMALSLLVSCVPKFSPAVAKARAYLLESQEPDGVWRGSTGMYGPRPFATDYLYQSHALAAMGLLSLDKVGLRIER